MKRRSVRVGDDLHDDTTLVVRGGILEYAVIRVDPIRYFSIYGVYGLSVFAAKDVTVDELAQEGPLVRFEILTLTQAGVLRAAGFRLEPTGRNPRHYTVSWNDLEAGIVRLVGCEHQNWRNPYYEN